MVKRFALATAAIVWAAAVALPVAQTGIPKSTQLNPGRARHEGEFVVIGCVSREGQPSSPTFTVTDSRGTPPARYRIDGDPDLLRVHIGHTVELVGPIVSAGTPAQTIKMLSLTYIATSCVKLK